MSIGLMTADDAEAAGAAGQVESGSADGGALTPGRREDRDGPGVALAFPDLATFCHLVGPLSGVPCRPAAGPARLAR